MVIYKTINLANGKFYVGKDSRNLDSYLGSGILLQRAINKYGIENFKKEILEECSSLDELAEREIYWIKKLNAIKEGYNIAEGGNGGNTLSNHPDLDKITKKVWEKRRANPNFKKRCKEIGEKGARTRKERHTPSPFKGKSHSKETKRLLKLKASTKIEDYRKEHINNIISLYKQGYPYSYIRANVSPCSYSLIKKVIKEFNLSRPKKEVHNKKVNLDEFKKMIIKNISEEDVCKYFNISKRSYIRYFYKLGFKKRNN